MPQILDPFSGFCNPDKGLPMKYFHVMTGKNPPKATGRVRRAFAANVRALVDVRFAGSTNKPKSLAVTAGISLSSVQRALSGETSPTPDTVEAIADALHVDPHKLIQPTNHDQVKIANPTQAFWNHVSNVVSIVDYLKKTGD